MNDYLWDKKGEPDTEVARLETLLGAFAHRPRPLELPAEAATTEPSTARLLPFVSRLRASRLFAPATLAAAAALLVATVLVASAFLRARMTSEGERAIARETAQPKEDARKDERPAPHEVVRRMLEPPPPEGGVTDGGKVERAAVVNLSNGSRQRHDARLAAAPVRRPRLAPVEQGGAGVGLTLEAMSARDGASALVENARLLTKEQLVYALRLTGAKLRDVRERAQATQNYER